MTLEEAKKCFPPIWVVYDRPRDFPTSLVVRIWYGEVADPGGALYPSLPHARAAILNAGGSVKLARHPEDDPCIAETWL